MSVHAGICVHIACATLNEIESLESWVRGKRKRTQKKLNGNVHAVFSCSIHIFFWVVVVVVVVVAATAGGGRHTYLLNGMSWFERKSAYFDVNVMDTTRASHTTEILMRVLLHAARCYSNIGISNKHHFRSLARRIN